MDEKRIASLMKSLDCTREEAIQVIKDDEAIDKGEKLFELTAEQKKASKSARQGDRKPTVYKFDTSKRKKVENLDKKAIVDTMKTALEEMGCVDFDVTNPEREFVFFNGGVKYKVTLACPRK